MATNSQLYHMGAIESPLVKKRKLENEQLLETNENPIQFMAQTQHTPTPTRIQVIEIFKEFKYFYNFQSSPNVGTFTMPTPLLLQQICLTRSQLEKLESSCAKFEDFKNLVQGCFVRIMFWGHYLVGLIFEIISIKYLKKKYSI